MILTLVLIGVKAKTVCDGPDYEPLGCFTDEFPFSIPLIRPGKHCKGTTHVL